MTSTTRQAFRPKLSKMSAALHPPRLHLDGALVQSRLAGDADEEVVSKRPQTAHRPHMVEIATVLSTSR